MMLKELLIIDSLMEWVNWIYLFSYIYIFSYISEYQEFLGTEW